jgi:hypothetical protein
MFMSVCAGLGVCVLKVRYTPCLCWWVVTLVWQFGSAVHLAVPSGPPAGALCVALCDTVQNRLPFAEIMLHRGPPASHQLELTCKWHCCTCCKLHSVGDKQQCPIGHGAGHSFPVHAGISWWDTGACTAVLW